MNSDYIRFFFNQKRPSSPLLNNKIVYGIEVSNASPDLSGNETFCDRRTCLVNTGIFDNLYSDPYWFAEEIAPRIGSANPASWAFYMEYGLQHSNTKDVSFYSWPVSQRDVTISTVPLPRAVWSFESCFLGVNGLA